MNKSYLIEKDFYINELEVEVPKVEQKVENKHQYLIIDRSGSMWSSIDNMIDTIIKYVEKLPNGSKVSVGYFSGEGEYGLSVPYTLIKEKEGVVKTINNYRKTIGCTNFVEILQKINEDCDGRESSLFFFTDGCHNCGSFNNVTKVLSELKDKLEVTVFVGCGYIDRDNMTEMAKTTDGSFIQLTSFNEFEQALKDFGESVEEMMPGCKVTLPENANNVCSILGKNIINYDIKEGKVFYKASNKSKQVLYFTSSTPIYEVTEVNEKDERSLRTLSYVLTQTNQTPKALKVLNKLGDKYLIRTLNNTFTLEEYAVVENILSKSIFDSRKRYKEGKVTNYLPDDNALCVMDILNMISDEGDIKIHLNDPEFKYKKISRAHEQLDGSKIIYPKDIIATTNNLKYHEDRLNVNLNVYYKADVLLDKKQFTKTNAMNEDLNRYGLEDKYPVNCIRNYSIIANGKLNVDKLVLSRIPKSIISSLGSYLNFREDSKYVLDLSTIPLINKSYLKYTSAKKLAEDYWNLFLLKNHLSVVSHLLKIKDTKEIEEKDLDKLALLEQFYIKNDMYVPPTKEVEATDEMFVYEFKVSFKGYSKASASSVIKKIQSGGNITDREKIVATYYFQEKDKTKNDLLIIEDQLKKDIKKLQDIVQMAKFAIILINRGCMDEFKDRKNMQIELNPNTSIQLEEKNEVIDNVITEFRIDKVVVKI